MSKFFKLIIFAFVVSMFCGCSILSKNTVAGSYLEEGTGYSMKKDIAFNMAVSNALMKISNEHSSSVSSAERQLYITNEKSQGRASESFTYEQNGAVKSNATINEYKIIRRRYTKYRNQWKCVVTVSVSFENVN